MAEREWFDPARAAHYRDQAVLARFGNVEHVAQVEVVDDVLDPVELLRRHVMDFGSCNRRSACDCSDAQAWRFLRRLGIEA